MVKGNKQGLIDGMTITALVSLENATVDAVPSDAIVNHEGADYIFIVNDTHSEDESHTKKETNQHSHEASESINSEIESEHDKSEHHKEEGTIFE
ncbi:MAG: efflux RND transporter periplasmic adaptor subunit, partial [Saprospiraceae bacterium]|nr:efflux RND transporter periplasmic adaptor subunit [Saprospiraceae bacterium]